MFERKLGLYVAYAAAEFEESSLLLLEHLYKEEPAPEVFFLLLQSLLRNGNCEAIKWMVSRHKEHFEYERVKKLYIEAMKRMGQLSEVEATLEVEGKPLEEVGGLGGVGGVGVLGARSTASPASAHTPPPVSSLSVTHYYRALIQKGRDKRASIEKALQADERNLEALIYIGMNHRAEELRRRVERVGDKWLRELFAKMVLETPPGFSIFSKDFLSPFSCCRISKELFNSKRTNELFQLAQYMGNLYPKHYFTYVAAGLYYLLIEKYTDAKRALFKSIQMNGTFGVSWLLLGYCQSYLCDCVNAISCYEKAEEFMEEESAASLGVALEYHRMRSYKKAEEKYLEIQKKHTLETCFNPYVSLLVTLGRYEEAIGLVKHRECVGEAALLKSFCYLFASAEDEAERALEAVSTSFEPGVRSKYYLLKGYICHIKKKHCEAIEAYQKAILDPFTSLGGLVNDLLELAIKNSIEKDDRKLICQYGEDVFDFLDLKSELPLTL